MVECIRKRCSAGCDFLAWEICSERAGSKKTARQICKVRSEKRSIFRKRWGKLIEKKLLPILQSVRSKRNSTIQEWQGKFVILEWHTTEKEFVSNGNTKQNRQ